MSWRVCASSLFFVVASLAGCQEPNPRSCIDGTCTDPSFPFCDVDGALAGESETCIAVTCTPGEFTACRGDQAITCNPAGTSYDLIQCPKGCDAVAGCRACDANETVCANGTVQTCDASGAIIESEVCPLGCFDQEPRCRRITPSNNLGAYLDMVDDPPDLDLAAARFDTSTGVVRAGPQVIDVPNFLAPGSGNGTSIRVFVARSIRIDSATITTAGDPRDAPGSAIALVADGPISITGEVLVDPRVGGAVTGCTVGLGAAYEEQTRVVVTGGGGGGHAFDGADGGAVTGREAGGAKGTASGTPGLVPLRGGCSGGFIGGSSILGQYSNGGGALQITSGTRLDIDAIINVSGGEGHGDRVGQTNAFYTGGGGAGGSILLEAPELVLGGDARLMAVGGYGAQGCQTPSTYCGARGLGATVGMNATAGASVPYTGTSNVMMMGGGGGGGLGRVRINTRDGTYTKSSTSVEAAAVTTGTIGTR